MLKLAVIGAGLILLLELSTACAADAAAVRLQSFLKIPLRDGVRLNGEV